MTKAKPYSARRQVRILFLITILTIGGAPKAILRLAKGLQTKGYEVLVVTLYSRRNSVPLFSEQFGVPIIDLEMKREQPGTIFHKLFAWSRGILRLYLLMRRGRYDILQTFIESSNIIGPIIGWLAAIPVRVSSQRATLVYKNRWFYWIDRWITNSFLVDKMVTVSETTRQFCIVEEKIRPEKLITIYNGVNLEKYSPLEPDQFQQKRNAFMQRMGIPPNKVIVTSVGRLHIQKGYDILLQAIPEVISYEENAVFLIVGDGEKRADLQSLSKSLGINNYVFFLGTRDDVVDILAVSDLFVLSSRWEGFPNALLEAMATGLATVSTAVDGSKELIINGVNGLLVPSVNSEQLGKAIIRLLADEELRHKLGVAARKQVEDNFSEQGFIDSFRLLYDDQFNKSC